MISMKEMCEASREWFKESPYNDNDSARTVYLGGFRGGVIWAQDEVVKKLWHDALEEPNPYLNAWIIMQSDKDSWCIVKYGGYNKDGGQIWQREAEKGHILRWCYLSDILPQEIKGLIEKLEKKRL